MTFPIRPWHRFSLRTLLVAVALVACWLGWNVEVVRRRAATRTVLESLGAEIDDEAGQYPDEGGQFPARMATNARLPPAPTNDQPPRVSLLRRWLGDRAVLGITFPPACPREVIDRFDREVPETPSAYRVY